MKTTLHSFNNFLKYPAIACIILCAALICSFACATKKAYSGPDLSSDKIGIITPDADKAFTEIRILSIDDSPLDFYEKDVAVWPGNHQMKIDVKLAFPYLNDRLGFTQNISFNVEAGHVYTVHAKIDSIKEEGFLWVSSDKQPDQFVGGTKIGPVKLLSSKH